MESPGDSPPEVTRDAWGIYADRGCKVAPACLSCPMPRCVYDTDEPVDHWQALVQRDQRIFELAKQGVPRRDIQRAFNLGWRQVERVIKRGGASDHHRRQLELDDAPGKPVESLRSPYRKRKPLPEIAANRRGH